MYGDNDRHSDHDCDYPRNLDPDRDLDCDCNLDCDCDLDCDCAVDWKRSHLLCRLHSCRPSLASGLLPVAMHCGALRGKGDFSKRMRKVNLV